MSTAQEKAWRDGIAGSPELYERVRIAFGTNRQMTLGRWCKENAVIFTTARNALLGASNSWRARELRRKIVRDARL